MKWLKWSNVVKAFAQERVVKVASKSINWACVTVHPWLPSEADQIEAAHECGLPKHEFQGKDLSGSFIDRVMKVKTTDWAGVLKERAAMLAQLKALGVDGETVFFATPLCVGISVKHAAATLVAFNEIGLAVYVHSMETVITPDNEDDFLDQVRRDAKAAAQMRYRKKPRKRKSKR